MRLEFETEDLISAGLGVLAALLGVLAGDGVLRPDQGGMSDNVPIYAFVGVVLGVVGLTVGRTRGIGRQIASIGCGIALLGLILFGGSIALDALLQASTS